MARDSAESVIIAPHDSSEALTAVAKAAAADVEMLITENTSNIEVLNEEREAGKEQVPREVAGQSAAAVDSVSRRSAEVMESLCATSAWVDEVVQLNPYLSDDLNSLPLVDLMERISGEPKCTDGVPPRKRHRNPQDATTDSRRRKPQKAALRDEVSAFRQSQRSLRREARSVNMKEVICRSTSMTTLLESPTNESLVSAMRVEVAPTNCSSNPFSPQLMSPTSTTVWSPTSVGDITSRFLASVQMKKQQSFQRLLTRELAQSQTSCGLEGGDSQSIVLEDELVIGAVDEEANWLPAPTEGIHPSSLAQKRSRASVPTDNGFLNDRTASTGLDEFSSSRLPSHVGGDVNSQQVDDAKTNSQEEAMTRAITRRHEIWKMQQRQIRANRLAATSSTVPRTAQSSILPTAVQATPLVSSRNADAAHETPSMEALLSMRALRNPKCSSGAGSSIRDVKLSDTDLTLIRRLNSFDNTSTQRVVVFGAATSSKGAKDNSSSNAR